MNILHICSDFARQSIYDQLVTALAKRTITQSIYIPVRTIKEIDRYRNSNLENASYSYSHILNTSDRIFYHRKISKVKADLCKKIDLSDIQLCHAHFLFSDGGVALKLKEQFGIPYIVAVRNTDLNFFFKYMAHLRPTGIKILENASKIIFISQAYKQQIFDKYIPNSLKNHLGNKSIVIPNGVSEYWLDMNYARSAPDESQIKLLYVGDFSQNKNIELTFQSVKHLLKDGYNIKLTIVGGGGNNETRIRDLAEKMSEHVFLLGRLEEKEELLNVYRSNDIFVMPSKLETFGLVYIEAMSQGLPVIYSKGQGIDGYFAEGEIGYSVRSDSPQDLSTRIVSIWKDYIRISNNCSRHSLNFSWEKISAIYMNLYNETKKERNEN